MALDAGVLSFTLEYGKDLKDMDWFGKMDPYAVIKCGTQTVRSKTHIDGGRHPVWAQTFEFNIINENTVEISVYDEDTLSRDDLIGTASVSLAKLRERRADQMAVPVMSKKGKQRGYLHISMVFQPNSALRPAAAQQPAYQQPMMMQPPAPYGYAPAPYPYAMPSYPTYPAPSYAAYAPAAPMMVQPQYAMPAQPHMMYQMPPPPPQPMAYH